MAISEKLKALIRSAWDDGAPCLVATQGPNGPNISPKGSMVVFDDDHLTLGTLKETSAGKSRPRQARLRDLRQLQGAARWGSELGLFAVLRKGRAARERAVCITPYSICSCPREQTHVGADTGIGVLVKIDRAADVRGKPLP